MTRAAAHRQHRAYMAPQQTPCWVCMEPPDVLIQLTEIAIAKCSMQLFKSLCSKQLLRGQNIMPRIQHPALRMVSGQAQQRDAPTGQQQPGPPKPRGPPVMLGPDGKPLEVVPIEKAGSEAWAGVAGIDTGIDPAAIRNRQLLLAGGDAAALVLFAIIGRMSHGEALDLETLQTALPFLVGWFATAPFLGGFGTQAQGGEVGPAASAAAKCWAVATPLGLVIRGLSRGYVPATPFILVTLAATGVLMVGWRTALAFATPKAVNLSPAAQAAGRKNSKGNPFEFLQLLSSLVKRW